MTIEELHASSKSFKIILTDNVMGIINFTIIMIQISTKNSIFEKNQVALLIYSSRLLIF